MTTKLQTNSLTISNLPSFIRIVSIIVRRALALDNTLSITLTADQTIQAITIQVIKFKTSSSSSFSPLCCSRHSIFFIPQPISMRKIENGQIFGIDITIHSKIVCYAMRASYQIYFQWFLLLLLWHSFFPIFSLCLLKVIGSISSCFLFVATVEFLVEVRGQRERMKMEMKMGTAADISSV